MNIEQFNFAGKKAFVRVDFNVPLDAEFNITDDTRIRAALPTLKKILADGGSLIIGSHLGRPKKVGGLVCEVNGRYRIEELESRLIRVINDLHAKTYSQYYLGELNFISEGITIEKRYGTALAALCFVDFQQPESDKPAGGL